MIIHAGDCSHNDIQWDKFIEWYTKLPIKHKILISGNHDFTPHRAGYKNTYNYLKEKSIIYLQDTSVTIEGIKIHGSPWSNMFGGYPFMAEELELQKYWNKIPLDTNILITHGPAYGILDKVDNNWNPGRDKCVGSKTLKEKIVELKNLDYHICGHIHEGYGMLDIGNYTTSYTAGYTAVNASILNPRENNKPIIIEYTKSVKGRK